MTEEIWKDIKDYEGLYQISSLGRVRSLNRYRKGNKSTPTIVYGKLLKPRHIRGGYLGVSLSRDDKAKNCSIHRLVAQAFIPNPDNLPQVNHKDEDKTNNCVDNLEWCDAKYNSNYGTRTQRVITSQSKPIVALKNNQIYFYFSSIGEAGRNGFNSGAICDCCNKKPKHNKHKGFRWMFVEDYLSDWWDMEMEKAA